MAMVGAANSGDTILNSKASSSTSSIFSIPITSDFRKSADARWGNKPAFFSQPIHPAPFLTLRNNNPALIPLFIYSPYFCIIPLKE